MLLSVISQAASCEEDGAEPGCWDGAEKRGWQGLPLPEGATGPVGIYAKNASKSTLWTDSSYSPDASRLALHSPTLLLMWPQECQQTVTTTQHQRQVCFQVEGRIPYSKPKQPSPQIYYETKEHEHLGSPLTCCHHEHVSPLCSSVSPSAKQ